MKTYNILKYLNLLLVIIIGIVVFKIIGPKNTPSQAISLETTQPQETDIQTSPPRDSTPDYNNLIKNNLFARAGQSKTGNLATSPAISPDNPDKNGISHLELTGTIAGPASIARAVIHNAETGITNVYGIGDKLGRGKLVQIGKKHVIIEIDGQEQTLELVSGSGSAPAGQQKALQPLRVVPVPISPIQKRNRLLEEFLEKVQITPCEKDGQTEGLQIQGLKGLQAAKYLDLKDGDVIRVVNGQKLTSKQKAFQVFKKARTQDQLNIEIRRGTRIKTLSFKLK